MVGLNILCYTRLYYLERTYFLKDFNLRPNAAAFVAVAALILLAFWGGYSYGKTQIPSEFLIEGVTNQRVGQPEDVDFSLFWDAWRVIQEEYVGSDNLDHEAMLYGAIEGMVKAIGDPYTTFFPPEEEKLFREDISGSFEGIGAEIGLRDDILTIIAPLEGSPAQKAGLRAGDRVVAIDGKSTQDMNLNEAVRLIRGEQGTSVVLSVVRDGEAEEITIVRDTIQVPVASWENRDGVAYVRLFSFSARSPEEFARIMQEVERAGLDRIVLDLRNNPGGFLEASQRIVGWFVSPGEVVVIEDFGEGSQEEDQEYRAVGSGVFKDAKIVVLINEGSASASEIAAGALRDINGTLLIGEKSFGKGSVQQLENLRKGALKVTVARWLTPKGTSISEEGLIPDVVVEMDEGELPEGEDPQLQRALEVVGGL